MGKAYEKLEARHRAFIAEQRMFFVATAPRADDGHVNVSPKGYDSFEVLDDRTVAYVDMGGSGIETVAHVKENGRLTIMFCAMSGPPNILRLYGKAKVLEREDPGFETMLSRFPKLPRVRNILVLSISRVSDSCGFGVPLYEYVGNRDQFERYMERRTPEDIRTSELAGNMQSIDGLPGLSKSSVQGRPPS